MGIENLFLKIDEDESPIARRRQMNNELQARCRARQPSEARRQANAESQRIRYQQETAEQSGTRRQRDASSHHLLREHQSQGIQDQ